MSSDWPLADLVLRTARLELRLPTDAELIALAERSPEDLETDPAWPAPPDGNGRRGTAILQWYWRALGMWKAEAWRLPLAVWADGELVGFQELEAERFAVLRTVETSSWLVPEVRGRGIGKEMRAAVLALAFDRLGALVATSGAWETNAASLGVSRAVGYEDNGWHLHDDNGQPAVMRRVLLTSERWTPPSPAVSVEGLEPCRAWFGAPD